MALYLQQGNHNSATCMHTAFHECREHTHLLLDSLSFSVAIGCVGWRRRDGPCKSETQLRIVCALPWPSAPPAPVHGADDSVFIGGGLGWLFRAVTDTGFLLMICRLLLSSGMMTLVLLRLPMGVFEFGALGSGKVYCG